MATSPLDGIFLRPQFSHSHHSIDTIAVGSSLELKEHTVRDGDEGIVATNDDATLTKKAVISLGYVLDPYIHHFTADKSGLKKSPEIHRGYCVRICTVWNMIIDFLRAARAAGFPSAQIVNIGCGFDTTYWRLKDALKNTYASEELVCSKFVELDLPSVVVRKAACIARHMELHGALEQKKDCESAGSRHIPLSASKSADEQADLISAGGDKKYFKALEDGSIWSSDYFLISCDLRQVSTFEHALFDVCKLDRSLPTLIVSECVLVYMKPEESQQIIESTAKNFDVAGMFVYDPVNLLDKFGETMIENLSRQGAGLLGAEVCDSMPSQITRLKACNFQSVKAMDMLSVYKTMSPLEKKRVESIEFLDETYLLEQLFQHYCMLFALSVRNESGSTVVSADASAIFSAIEIHM